MDKKQTFSLWYVLLALLVIVALQDFIGTKLTQNLSYREFKQAPYMARHMVTHYGMSEALGLPAYDTRPAALHLDDPALPEQRNCSERTAELIDSEACRLLDELLRATLPATPTALSPGTAANATEVMP